MPAIKRDWESIDNHASKATATTFESLVAYLDQPIEKSADRDIFMTRALLYWLKCNSKVQEKDYPQDSPQGLACKMFSEKLAFADGFSRMCKEANIDCRVVLGISKTGDYKPGDLTVDKGRMQSRWNKLFLNGQWWPVNPRYILHNRERGLIKEFWFLTDPELFVQYCLPDDPEDQMLPKSKRINSERAFMKLPFLSHRFHELNMRLTSEDQCIIETVNGCSKISFKIPRKLAKDFECEIDSAHLSNVLDLKGNKSDAITKAFAGIKIDKLIFSSRKKGHFIFELRCPVEMASYNLTIEGGKIDERKTTLVKTRIVCREKMKNFKEFPDNKGSLGWGFGPRAHAAGLLSTTKFEPKLLIQDNHLELKFGVEKRAKKEYRAELSRENISTDLTGFVQSHLDTVNNKFIVKVLKPPVSGEYALTVFVVDGVKQKGTPVCQYLVTTLLDLEKLEDEYYDSSDGTSDVDEEINKLEDEVAKLTAQRDKLKKQLQTSEQRVVNFDQKHVVF
ncbi:lim and transglutaminase domain protein ltd-1-like isoform X2 [Dreissena polymorpha]|uniref:Kyphoscoliosis peptidase n=1 Tax=Dreissena polymorpha TaxID=45954 RepID=A0A9D4JDU0_DREPO|nr:lim and transglutaminase domain protein ltd-1-like isoform X2 [Dreissena polymorpha]KAH3809256.1 hypothetical protein DPMN_137617 [Dreissena polymorpha]